MMCKFGIKQRATLHQAGTVTNTEKFHTHLGVLSVQNEAKEVSPQLPSETKTGEYYEDILCSPLQYVMVPLLCDGRRCTQILTLTQLVMRRWVRVKLRAKVCRCRIPNTNLTLTLDH